MTQVPGQVTIEEAIKEAEMSYIEECVACSGGLCGRCEVQVTDHETGETVPCPCRAAGHDA